jgi:hypothetical protein
MKGSIRAPRLAVGAVAIAAMAFAVSAAPASADRTQDLFVCTTSCGVVPLPAGLPDIASTVATTEFNLCGGAGGQSVPVPNAGTALVCFTQSNNGQNGTSVLTLPLGPGSGAAADSQFSTPGTSDPCNGAVYFVAAGAGGADVAVGGGSADNTSDCTAPSHP